MFCLAGVGVVVVSSYLVRILLSLLSILLICLCKWSKTKIHCEIVSFFIILSISAIPKAILRGAMNIMCALSVFVFCFVSWQRSANKTKLMCLVDWLIGWFFGWKLVAKNKFLFYLVHYCPISHTTHHNTTGIMAHNETAWVNIEFAKAFCDNNKQQHNGNMHVECWAFV